MYSQALLAYFHDASRRGSLEEPSASGCSQYPICGDRLRLELKIEDGRILAANFQGNACGAVIATAALGTELLTGATLEEARQINSFILDQKLGGLPPSKRHAYLMFLDCLNQALNSHIQITAS